MTNKNTEVILMRILGSIISIALAVSGWFLNQTMGKMQEMEKRIYSLEINNATISSNRFTSSDFIKAKEIIDSHIVSADKRIVILEENNKTIRDLLTDIREDIKEIKAIKTSKYGQD